MSTVTTDVSPATSEMSRHLPTEVPLHRLLLTLILGFVGFVLCIASLGLWIVQSGSGMPGVSLMKLGVSIFMMVAGLCCIVMAHR